MSEKNYWHRMAQNRMSRRGLLRASARAGVGAAGLALVGCGDDDDDDEAAADVQPEDQAEAQADAQAQADEEQTADEEEQAVAQVGGETRVHGGTISAFDGGDLASFDGFLTFGYRAFLHGANVYPMLTRFSNNADGGPTTFEPEFWLADSVETPDLETYTFNIHPDAVWEDIAPTNGRAVTSEDVAFAFSGDRYAGYPNGGILRPHLDSLDTPDESTITFNLNKAFSPMMLYMAHHAGPYVMPPELVEGEMSRETMVGAGPYTLENGGSYEIGTRVTYKRNPTYFRRDQGPWADELIVNFISDQSAQVAAFISGELNFGSMGPDVRDQVIDQVPDGQFVEHVSVTVGGLNVDLLLEPFNDPRVRQALSNAMDRDAVLALNNSLEVGGWAGPLVPLPPWFIEPRDPSTPLHEFYVKDLTRANQLLDAAGVDPAAVGPINFAVPSVSVYGQTFNQSALIYQQNFADLGFDFQLDVREPTEHYSTTFNGSGNDGGASLTLSVAAIEPDEVFVNMYGPTSGRSPIINGEEMAKDSTLTDLLADQRAAPDVPSRKEIIDELQVHLAEQMYNMALPLGSVIRYGSPDMQDFRPLATFAFIHVWEDLHFLA